MLFDGNNKHIWVELSWVWVEGAAPSSSCDVIVPMEHNDHHLEASSQGSNCDDMAISGATGVATDSPATLEAPVTRSQSRPDTSVPV